MPRRAQSSDRAPRGEHDLENLLLVQPAYAGLQERCLARFGIWMRSQNYSLTLPMLATASWAAESLLREYGTHLYVTNSPMYLFVVTVTAMQSAFPDLKGRLARS